MNFVNSWVRTAFFGLFLSFLCLKPLYYCFLNNQTMVGIRIFTLLTLLGTGNLVAKSQLIQPKEDRVLASQQIVGLKEGALLVRLKQNSLKIQALEKYGRTAEAKDETKKMELENASTIRAVKSSYSFSKVYFFYAEYSDRISKRDWNGLVLDTNLNPVDLPKDLFILVGEFGETKEMNIDAFVILNEKFEQLGKPFPFMVKRINNLVANRRKEDILRILDAKFESFWEDAKDYLARKKEKERQKK
jgi:hypothetical protein